MVIAIFENLGNWDKSGLVRAILIEVGFIR